MINNLVLKQDFLKKFNLELEVISGKVDSLQIEGFLIEKRVKVVVEGVNIKVFIPNKAIMKVLFNVQNSMDKNFVKDKLIENLKEEIFRTNEIYSILNSLDKFDLSIRNINIEAYFDFSDQIHQFNLSIEELSSDRIIFSSNNYDDSNIELFSKMDILRFLKLLKMKLKATHYVKEKKFLINNKEELSFFLMEKQSKALNIINDISFECCLGATNLKFTKFDYENTLNISNLQKIQNLTDFSKLDFNTALSIKVISLDLTLNQIVIINILKSFLNSKNELALKKNLAEKGKVILQRTILKLKRRHHNKDIDDLDFHIFRNYYDFQFKNSRNSKAILFDNMIYTYLIMIEKGYISNPFNMLLLRKLLFDFKIKLGKDIFFLDYLVDKHKDMFLKEVKANSANFIFLNLEPLESIKEKKDNINLLNFLIFILNEFVKLKVQINKAKLFDNYLRCNLHIVKVIINIEKGENKLDDNEAKLLDKILFIKNKFNNTATNIDHSNLLAKIEIFDIIASSYTNQYLEYFIFKIEVKDIIAWDISYTKTNLSRLNELMFPLLRINYNLNIKCALINKQIQILQIKFPLIYVSLDPYFIFLCYIFADKLRHELRNIYFEQNALVLEAENNKSQLNLNNDNFKLNIGFFKLKMTRVIFHLNYNRNFGNQNISILGNFNQIKIMFNKADYAFEVSLNEILVSAYNNLNVWKFLKNQQNLEHLSNILNIFNFKLDLNAENLIKKRSIELFLPEIYIKITKSDLDIIQNFLIIYSALFKYRPDYKRNDHNINNNNNNGGNVIRIERADESADSNADTHTQGFGHNKTAERLYNNPQYYISNFSNNLFSSNKFNSTSGMPTIAQKLANLSWFLSINVPKLIIEFQLTKKNDKLNINLKNETQEFYKEHPEANIYKNIVFVIENSVLFVFYSKIHFSLLTKFQKIVALSTYFTQPIINKGDRQILLINSEKHSLMLSPEDYLINTENLMQLDFFIYFAKEQGSKNMTINLPHIYLALDHLFLYLLKHLSSFQNKFSEEFNNLAIELMAPIVNDNPYFHYDIETKGIRRKIFTKKRNYKKWKKINVLMAGFNLDVVIDNFNMFSVLLESINLDIDLIKDILQIKDCEIKYLIDNRPSSVNNSHLIFNQNHKITLNMIYFINEKSLTITIDRAKIIYLNRIVMDLVEYIYYILIKEVINHEDYCAYYNKRPDQIENEYYNKVLEEDKKKEKYYVTNGTDKNYDTVKSKRLDLSPKRTKKFCSIKEDTIKRRDNFLNDSILNELQEIKFKYKLIFTRGEILVAMNSIKKNKILLEFDALELINHCNDKAQYRNISNLITLNSSKIINNEKTAPLRNIDILIKTTNVRISNVLGKKDKILIKNEFGWFNENLNNNDKVNRRNVYSDVGLLNIDSNNNYNNQNEEFLFSQNKNNYLGDFSIVIDITNDKGPFSPIHIYVLFPYAKLRIFPDVYEKIIRIFTENLSEQTEIIGNISKTSKNFGKKHNMSNKYLQLILIFEDIHANIYNFPSQCLLHKSDCSLNIKFHADNVSDCKYSKVSPPVELDKLCHIRIKQLYVSLSLFSNKDKNFYIEIESTNCDLNKYLKAFSKLHSMELIKTLPNQIEKMFYCNISMFHNHTAQYSIDINHLIVNFVSLPLISIQKMFTKFFFFYQNQNIKHVDYDISSSKIIKLRLNDLSIILQSNYIELTNCYYEMSVKLDIEFNLKSSGNTLLGPFNDFKKWVFNIKEVYLNDLKQRKFREQQLYGSNYASGFKYSSLISSNILIILEIISHSADKLQSQNRFYHLDCKIQNKLNPLKSNFNMNNFDYDNFEVVNIVDINLPKKFRNFIENFTYKAFEVIGLKAEELETNDIKNNLIHITLNTGQIFFIKKIFQDTFNYYNDFYKSVLYFNNEYSAFDVITYNKSYSINIDGIIIKLCESQFSSKLFNLCFANFMAYITNQPEDDDIENKRKKIKKDYQNERKKNSFDRATASNLHNNIYEEIPVETYTDIRSKKANTKLTFYGTEDINAFYSKQWNLGILAKILIKISYYNSNHEKWEPFLEPMPTMFNYFKNDLKQYILFDILSFEQSFPGIDNICRQRNFHSMNLNLNETLLESINHFLIDYKKVIDVSGSSLEFPKQLIITNLTEYRMNIMNQSDFEAQPQLSKTTEKLFYTYKSDRIIGLNKENIKVQFFVEKNKHKRHESISEDDSNEYNRSNKISIPYSNNLAYNNSSNLRKQGSFATNQNASSMISNNIIINEDEEIRPVDIKLEQICTEKRNISPNAKRNAKFMENERIQQGEINISIEKTCKIFNIIKSENSKHLTGKEEMDELQKNYDEKFSILLPNEHFLVTEINLNIETNIKSITFRSNEGIKNELDFPVRLRFHFFDTATVHSYYENPIVNKVLF